MEHAQEAALSYSRENDVEKVSRARGPLGLKAVHRHDIVLAYASFHDISFDESSAKNTPIASTIARLISADPVLS